MIVTEDTRCTVFQSADGYLPLHLHNLVFVAAVSSSFSDRLEARILRAPCLILLSNSHKRVTKPSERLGGFGDILWALAQDTYRLSLSP